METEERHAFSSWQYVQSLQFVSAKDKNSRFLCTLCAGGNKILFASKTSMSKFKKHLASHHSTVKLVENGKQKAAPATHAGGPSTAKQQKMDFCVGANPKPIRRQ